MSEFVEVKTQDLSGAALNWATFCAVYPGMRPTIKVTESETRLLFKGAAKPVTLPRTVRLTYSGAYGFEFDWYPSSDWDCGGALLDKFEIEILRAGSVVHAKRYGMTNAAGDGETILIAACRAIVTSVLGETVSVPKELLS
ncbi:DUF2591 family protein [Pseudomonas veronii]|uniref:DUF2591 family protein n=1 Tax=Pseudomonas veronii TaxID=76761 RepID=A0ABS0VS81_PSEVE|nr:phage protein NinX family protein [Pseudomonas veronii]MBI6554486.1 DUF2591 family protein [Pseudomonas veronii]MBI6652991.1 DUF2591 family protein [Pseudomonas veronii]